MLEDRPYMRESSYETRWSTTVVLIITIAVVYALQLVMKLVGGIGPDSLTRFERLLALNPGDPFYAWGWQLFTFQFLHGGPLHLLLNCAMIYVFGRPVEQALGRRDFLFLYFGSGVFGGLLQLTVSLIFKNHFGSGPVLGASAGLFGLMGAFAILNWEQQITALVAFILPVTMRAKYLILVMAIIALLGLLEKRSAIAHAAHLGGLLGGLVGAKWVAEGKLRWLDWGRIKAAMPRRELVKTSTSRRASWHKQTATEKDDLPPAEFISREVDPILDKISAHGIQSLTERERKILEAARARMSRR